MNKESNIVNNINYPKQTQLTPQNKVLKRVRRKEPILSRLNKNKGK